jgi:hypothetical protein
MGAPQQMQQQVRLGFRMQGLDANMFASQPANGGVSLWNAAPAAALPASRYPVANWCTVTNSATLGSTFKFLRKGIFGVVVVMPFLPDASGAVMIGGALDAPLLTAAAVTPTQAIAFYEDYDFQDMAGAIPQICLRLNFEIEITNTLRSSALASNGTPNGTMRIHIGDGAGGVAREATVSVTDCCMWINQLAELFG